MKILCAMSLCCLFYSLSLSAQVPADRDVLLNAEGAGQAKYAETNGYPGPKHVLDLADTLKLNQMQRNKVKEIFNEMESRAKELGQRIVRIEEEMNTAFRQGLVNEKSIKDDAEQIGRLRGRLRAVHLSAHLKTKEILSKEQRDLYKILRNVGNSAQKQEHKH
jgi:Spy/CpxP family protein refolding chaperone